MQQSSYWCDYLVSYKPNAVYDCSLFSWQKLKNVQCLIKIMMGHLKNFWINARLICTYFNAIFMMNPNMAMKTWNLNFFLKICEKITCHHHLSFAIGWVIKYTIQNSSIRVSCYTNDRIYWCHSFVTKISCYRAPDNCISTSNCSYLFELYA